MASLSAAVPAGRPVARRLRRPCRRSPCACSRSARSSASTAYGQSPVDVHILAVTDHDLRRLVQERRFRRFEVIAAEIRTQRLQPLPLSSLAGRLGHGVEYLVRGVLEGFAGNVQFIVRARVEPDRPLTADGRAATEDVAPSESP